MRAEQGQHELMRKTLLGRTGLQISELAFGGGVTGGILIDADEATRHAALARAVAAGINWIDTAPLYGNGASEETIGRHLGSLSPRPHVSTKVRIEAEDLGDIAGAIERSLEHSLRRLKSDRLTLLQLHNHLGEGVGARLALRPEQVLGRGGVADTFDRLRQQGLVRAVGLTVAGDGKACREVIDSGRFDTAQVYYNAINPSAAWQRLPAGWRGGQDFCGVLAACSRQAMGVLNIRIWAGGVLATAARPERLFVMTADTDADNEVRCAAAVRAALASEASGQRGHSEVRAPDTRPEAGSSARAALGDGYGTPAQAALRFALGNKDFATRVIGITTVAQLEEALAALAQGPLPAAAMSRLDALWSNGFGAG
jgi:aryl-alcohol dehydrogenase-like predicted oxidoreductase